MGYRDTKSLDNTRQDCSKYFNTPQIDLQFQHIVIKTPMMLLVVLDN